MSRMEKASQRVGHDTDDVSKYRRYVQAKLRTRVEMWRRTGNPLWLTEDQAQEDAFGLLGSLVSRLPDAALAQQTVDFLTIRAAAVSPKKRSRELMELGRASSILRVHGMSVEIRLPDMADPPRDGKTATKLPDLTALMRFCNEAKATPTHRAFGEFIIDRLGDYNETFFTGLDALRSEEHTSELHSHPNDALPISHALLQRGEGHTDPSSLRRVHHRPARRLQRDLLHRAGRAQIGRAHL